MAVGNAADESASPPQADPATDVKAGPAQRAFGHAYWMLNSIEMFERLAYFGIRAVVPIYIMQATEPGGLHLTAAHKGWIYAWWAVFQSFLPMVTGGYADRYGYKRVMACAISMNVVGYIMMAYMQSYYGFFAGILVLATGTAFFKPSLQGSLAQNLTKENSSLGWGVFYWVVNIGAFGAPFLATIILGKPHSAEGWRNLFLASAGYTCCNLLLLFTFKDVPSGASKARNPLQVLWHTLRNIAEPRLIAWLLIMSCFWLMMYQLWDLHPNFIEDWVDSASVAAHVPFDAWREYGDRGIVRVPQQILLNLNAGLIILLILPISWLVRKMRTLSSMLIGMSVATTGVLVAGLTGNGWILLLGIVFFSLGEMLTGPKKNEYLGLIAPKGKKGLYLGYVNIPIGVGVGLGSWIAGHVYGNFGEKASLALDHLAANTQLVARAAQSADWSDTLELVPELLDIDRGQAFEIACAELGQEPDTAASILRDSFRFDSGQITNLGLTYLALQPEFKQRATAGLGATLADEVLDEGVHEIGRRLAAGGTSIDQIGVARFVDLLPKAIGIRRLGVFEILRDRVNRSVGDDRKKDDAAIVDMLWDRLGEDRETLNNLALEYLAQGTDRVRTAVASMSFGDTVKDIEDRLGIGRTKSFAALSAAMGADDEAVEQALARPGGTNDVGDVGARGDSHTSRDDNRYYVYLANQPHHRFLAVARKDWTKDAEFLKEMIASDEASTYIVAAEIDKESWTEQIWSAVRSLFTSDEKSLAREGTDYERLAGKQDLIQKALDAKDWSRSPRQAAHLLELNPFEARTLVAVEVERSAVTATQLLWDTYKPQYFVWIPFAAIGVLATIALGIFGQMAKRWADMNA
ncbi:MAG: MFS transporter [Planctomycetota bacterium]|jgi:MFS family permease